MKMVGTRHLLLLALTLTIGGVVQAGEPRDAAAVLGERWQGYQYREVMVPMRDGSRLRTHIMAPKDAPDPLPIILTRTPYGWRLPAGHPNGPGDLFRDVGFHAPMMQDGYIFVGQDERGKFGSEGTFEILRPFRSVDDPDAVDDITDTYDTIEWLLANLSGHNGKVGLNGTSYRGWHVMAGLINPHPAVKAAAPSAAMSEGFLGDDFYHNGAYYLAYSLPFTTRNADNYRRATADNPLSTGLKGHDGYDFFLRTGTIKALRQYFPKPATSTEAILANDRFNDFYTAREVRRFIRRPVTVPTLHVTHLYDGEDLYGPQAFYQEMEAFDTDDKNSIVAGPWYHGAWRYDDGEKFGPLSFGSKTGVFFTQQVLIPFFRHHLKGDRAPDLPEALIFDTGANAWRRFERWPPADVEPIRLYLHARGRASIGESPTAGDGAAFDRYSSDPANPVPYYPRPNFGGWQKDFKVQDQRFALERPDVLVYATNPLEADLTLCGAATARLFASSEGTDTDWVVKVIDSYPLDHEQPHLRGFQRMVYGDILRAKFRHSFAKPEPVPAGAVEAYEIPLLQQCHTVRKGHRLMVHVQSSWFPLFDRNPNQFMTIAEANPEDYRAVENRIYRSMKYPSHVVLSVLPESGESK